MPSAAIMKLRLIRYVFIRCSRNLSGSRTLPELAKTESFANAALENDYFYRMMAARPAYIVGKLHSIEITEGSNNLQNFLHKDPQNITKHLFDQIIEEASHLSPANVKALLLRIQSLSLMQRDILSKNEIQHLLVVLNERSVVLSKSEKSLSLDFTLADLYYRLNYSRSPFVKTMLYRQSLALKYLSKTDFLQHLFFSNSVRVLQPSTKAAVPIFIENVADELDLEEMALICFSLFKCQCQLPSLKNWLRLVRALEKHEGEIADLVLGVFAKYLRYLNPTKRGENVHVRKFLQVVSSRHSECSLTTHLRMANVGTQVGLCDTEVVRTASAKMIKQLGTCRIKDVAMSLYTSAYFDVEVRPYDAQLIIERLKNEKVSKKFHQWLVRATLSLAILGYLDETLLVRSLDRNVIDFSTTHTNSNFDVYALWILCKLRFPKLVEKVNLPQNEIQSIRNDIQQYTDCSIGQAIQLNQLQSLIRDRLHFKSESVQTLDLFVQKDIHVEDILVIVVHSPLCFFNGTKMLGLKKFRLRLLRELEFNVVEIHPQFFSDLNEAQKLQRLRKLIHDHLPL